MDKTRERALQTISDYEGGDGGVLEALWSFVRAIRGTKGASRPDARYNAWSD